MSCDRTGRVAARSESAWRWIQRQDLHGSFSLDFGAVTRPDDQVMAIAWLPLTDNETWTPMRPGERLLFREGELVCGI